MLDKYLDNIVNITLEKLFGNLEGDKLDMIKSKLSIMSLKRGDVLFKQNDEADGIYILLSGKLEVIAQQHDGASKRVGFVNRAETVGEMALLSDDLRSATVLCFRNSLLAKMDNKTFIELCYSNAEFALRVSRFIVSRLKESIHTKRSRIKITNISLHDSGLSDTTNTIINSLLNSFKHLDNVVIIDKALTNKILDVRQDAQEELNPEHLLKVDHYINDLELHEKQLFFDLREMGDQMVNHLIDFSDLAIEFFDASLVTNKGNKTSSFIQSIANIQSKITYVFCHEEDVKYPQGTHYVLDQLKEGPHAHARTNSASDLKRLVRYITGNSIGLVLGGGGAKGIAHLGVLKAMEECNIPVDFIAGTSMGAIYASLFAKHLSFKDVYRLSAETFLKSPTAPLDLNFFPKYSIYSDKKINRKLQELFGDMYVEDLWLPFYCISSNLTKPEMTIHDKGKLKDVIRTSMSVPGLFKPVLIDKNVHVDGGVFNNIPIDVMMQKNIGYIIASRVDKEEIRQEENLPNFLYTLIKSTIANSDKHSNSLQGFVDLYFQPNVARYGLLNWKAHEQIYQEGYRHAKEILAENEALVHKLSGFA